MGRQVRSDKGGAIPRELLLILERLSVNAETWLDSIGSFDRSLPWRGRPRIQQGSRVPPDQASIRFKVPHSVESLLTDVILRLLVTIGIWRAPRTARRVPLSPPLERAFFRAVASDRLPVAFS